MCCVYVTSGKVIVCPKGIPPSALFPHPTPHQLSSVQRAGACGLIKSFSRHCLSGRALLWTERMEPGIEDMISVACSSSDLSRREPVPPTYSLLCGAGVVVALLRAVIQEPRLLFAHPWGVSLACGSRWLTTMSNCLATGGREPRRRGTVPSFKTLSLGLCPGKGVRLLLSGSAVPCVP